VETKFRERYEKNKPSPLAGRGFCGETLQRALKPKQVRGFAPIGMLECWNIGKMGLGILQYWVNG
jgi:hypothetical protein